MMKKEELAETVNFVDIFDTWFDKWFDCLNVCNMSAGKVTRDPFKSPYRSEHDFRLNVSCLYETYANFYCMYSGLKRNFCHI